MVKNKKLILVISFLALVSLAFLVSATISTINPLDGTNHSSAALVLFNVTFLNNTDLLIPGTSQTNVNATFFRVSGSTRTVLTNSSQCSSAGGAAGTVNCWTTFNVSGVDGFFNITATIYNLTAQRNSSVNISSVYFDSTRPVASADSFTNPVRGGNYSQNLAISISATDATIGVQRVFFNITNASSGLQNATLFASNPTGSTWNFTVNTSHYLDGRYVITAFVNDTLNNQNNSAAILNLTFDNTKPSASYTCEDYLVEEDEEMTCNCTSSDNLSGVLSVNFDDDPSTSAVGNNFQETCTVTDYAGNTQTSTIMYNVSEVESGSSGGSSGGSSSGSSSGTTTGGTSAGSNSTTNSTTNSSSSGANQLEGNQENQGESNFKINYWIVSIIVLVLALAGTAFVLIKKGILQRILKFNR